LTSTIFYILHYPEALDRLQLEVRNTFEDSEEIRIGAKLNSCKYLFACIDEAMRLSPSVGAILQREVLDGGLLVDGEMLPAGTDVGVSAYSIHHNESYFPDAFLFKPERWLEDRLSSREKPKTDRSSISRARSAFASFGVGRTSCVGKYLAYQEIAVVLGRMLWLYDMQLEPGTSLGEGSDALGKGRQRKNEFQTYEKFVSSHIGPMVQFKTRA
jgi:cytochrome P450